MTTHVLPDPNSERQEMNTTSYPQSGPFYRTNNTIQTVNLISNIRYEHQSSDKKILINQASSLKSIHNVEGATPLSAKHISPPSETFTGERVASNARKRPVKQDTSNTLFLSGEQSVLENMRKQKSIQNYDRREVPSKRKVPRKQVTQNDLHLTENLSNSD